MQPEDYKLTRGWTKEELEDEKLRNFMVTNRRDMLTLLKVTHEKNPTMLSTSLATKWFALKRYNIEL